MVDSNYAESWVSRPDVCRCCLVSSGTWDVTSSYITETGESEVYSDMLRECYGITLSFLTMWGPSKMVCELCVRHLRGALSFRKQVMQAERQFVDYRNSTSRVFKPVVVRVEEPQVASSTSSDEDDDNETVDVLALTDSTDRSVIDRMATGRKKRPAKGQKKGSKVDTDEDMDSDTPISEISKKNNVTESVADKAGDTFEMDSVASAEIVPKKRATPNKGATLQARENNRLLRANITVLLKNTTIIPFRYINDSQYHCHYCDKRYLLFKDLKNHVKVRHWGITERQIMRTIKCPRDLVKADVSELSCRLCGSSYNKLEKLVDHLKILHRKRYHKIPDLKHSHGILGYDLSDGIRCYICREEFRFLKNLSIHMNDHDADYTCNICGKRFVVAQRLAVHLDRHKPPDLKCKFCPRIFKSISMKNYHTRKEHTKPVIYKCPECPSMFALYNQRLKHMIDKHKFKKPDTQCHHCSKHFATISTLSAHIKFRHLKEEYQKFPCEICDKTFCDKWMLKRHLIVHTGKRNFACQYCDKRFAKSFTLKVHVKMHLNERDYACNLCGRAYVQKFGLTRHLATAHRDNAE